MAALNQGGLILPGATSLLHDAAAVSGAPMIMTTPILTASGVTIPMPTVIMPPMIAPSQQDDDKTSLGRRTPNGDVSPLCSPHGPRSAAQSLSVFRPASSPGASTAEGWARAAKDVQRSKGKTTETEDHPLDLSTTKKEKENEKKLESPNFFQPDKDGALDARRVIRSPDSDSASSREKIHKLSPSPSSRGKDRPSSVSPSRQMVDSPRSATTHPAMMAGHPAGMVPPGAFLVSSPATSIAMSPRGKASAAALGMFTAGAAGSSTISKCSDCNIVFYKRDNYLIHRKHYCSGGRKNNAPLPLDQTMLQYPPGGNVIPEVIKKRPSQDVSPNRHCDLKPASRESPPKPSASPPSAKKAANDVMYKYYCVPCRIKFSNASVLEAHKEYYCPAGKDSEHSVILHSASSSDQPAVTSPSREEENTSPESPVEEFTCSRCSSVFASSRLLRLHMCEGGFPCPHCDHVAITENRLAEHLKVHAPTRAFRCTICGYRGNTARGMRMHGKTHIDEGIDFTDENMLEYHEPALVPIIPNPSPGTCTDTELLRLKNEPYKRRRSRKAYEKYDYPLPKVDIPKSCHLCGQTFANADYLASHFKVHQIAASQYVAGLMKCINCDYVGKNPDDLRAHFEVSHTNQLRRFRNGHLSPSHESMDRYDQSSNSSCDEQQIMVVRDPNSPFDEKPFLSNDGEEKENDTLSSELHGNEDSPKPFSNIKQEPIDVNDIDMQNNSSHSDAKPLSTSQNQECNDVNTESSSPTLLQSRQFAEQKSPNTNPSEVCVKSEPVSDCEDGVIPSPPLPHPALSISPQADTQDESNRDVTNLQRQAEDEFVVNRLNDQMTEQVKVKSEQIPTNQEVLSPKTSERPPSQNSQHSQHSRHSQHSCTDEKPHPSSLTPHPSSLTPHPSSPPHEQTGDVTASRTTPNSAIKRSSSPGAQILAPISPFPSPMVFPPHPSLLSVLPPSFAFHPAANLHGFFLPTEGQQAIPSPSPSTSFPAASSHTANFPAAMRDDRPGSRYCQNCDISFSKQATYLAHKKFYCRGRPRGDVQPSAKA